MHDAAGVLTHLVYGRMDGETGGIYRIRRGADLLAFEIDLDQAGGGDLLEHQPVGVDEEVMLRAWDARGNVGEDEIVPAVERDQSIAGREIDADGGFDIGNRIDVSVH